MKTQQELKEEFKGWLNLSSIKTKGKNFSAFFPQPFEDAMSVFMSRMYHTGYRDAIIELVNILKIKSKELSDMDEDIVRDATNIMGKLKK